MKIYFWSVGKSHETYVKEGIELFTKRISHYFPFEWKIFPPSKNSTSLTEEEIKKNEGVSILNSLQNDDILIALDENGKQLNSIELQILFSEKQMKVRRILSF
jgi:23S rRNA (pseudouridine1915-N3)-methyltransferase